MRIVKVAAVPAPYVVSRLSVKGQSKNNEHLCKPQQSSFLPVELMFQSGYLSGMRDKRKSCDSDFSCSNSVTVRKITHWATTPFLIFVSGHEPVLCSTPEDAKQNKLELLSFSEINEY